MSIGVCTCFHFKPLDCLVTMVIMMVWCLLGRLGCPMTFWGWETHKIYHAATRKANSQLYSYAQLSLSNLMSVSYGHFLMVPHSYHHIPYAFQIDVQQALHIPLSRSFQYCILAFFLLFPSWCVSFLPQGGENTQRVAFICVNTWVVTRKHYRRSTQLKHLF